MGRKYLSFLDLDIFKEDVGLTLQQALKGKLALILNYLDCFYVETKKGYHVYMLSDDLLPNEILYHTDKFGKRRKIGSIQSKGKYVVGFDSLNKKLVENGKWFWHVRDLGEIKEELSKFFIEVGKEKKLVASSLLNEVEKAECQKKPLKINEILNKPTESLFKTSRQNIQVKILSKQKIPWLTDLVKVWYKNLSAKQNISYFLLNDYQHFDILPNLSVGSIRNICLINGIKHPFFSRINQNTIS
jgi:hypothetical protein